MKEDIIERMKRLSIAGRQADIPPVQEVKNTKVVIKKKGYLERLLDEVDRKHAANKKAKANNNNRT